jgi:uncharacterized membrane protein
MSRKRKKPSAVKSPPGPWLWLARLMILVAGVGSAYLAMAALDGERLPGCGPESGCDDVLNSRWAQLFGVPVSFGALLVYGTLVAATCGFPPRTSAPVQRGVRATALFAALLTLVAAVWFIGLQIFVVGAFCAYCNTIHVCGSAAALLILLKYPLIARRGLADQTRSEFLVARTTAVRVTLGALLVVALLGLGQSLHEPQSFVTRGIAGGNNPEIAPTAGRTLRLHGGAFEFDLGEVPFSGSVEAAHVVVNLFDYTCQHCRVLHGFLKQAHRTFSNQLAVVNLPSPLDPACNALVTRHLADHTNACDYARIGLAVWRADRAQSAAFDEWIFTPSRPPTTDQAREQAIELVGADAFATASSDPWIDRQLEEYTRLFATNYQQSRISRLPQLIIGTNIVVGNFRRVDDLYRLLSTQLEFPVPAQQLK